MERKMKRIINKVLGIIGKTSDQKSIKKSKLNEAELNEIRSALTEIELRDR